jgi:hypothetical protein
MKRLLFAGLVVGLFSGSTAFAQNNSSSVDDVYYNGSQAQKDAKADAKKQKKQQQQAQSDADYYNSSTGTNDGYNTNGDAYTYNDSYTGDDTYIDYDDDSYTSRIRRFQYPMYNVGYWGGIYSPFWCDPFYSNPYYGWGGWYSPGFSIGFGWGGGPYWNNCWGMNTWYGYGMFNSWYSPFGGWGGGYGAGYWNGYYAGLYDGGNRYNYGRGAVNYGPRGSRNGFNTVGAYGRSSGMRAGTRSSNMVEPMNGRNAGIGNRNAAVNGRGIDNRTMQVDGQRGRGISRGDAVRFDNSDRVNEVNQRSAGELQEAAPVRSRGGFFGGNNDRSNTQRSQNVERSEQPSRSFNVERSQPSRSYSNPAPSRSYSSPAPSRSFGGGSGGGGGRMSGGRR